METLDEIRKSAKAFGPIPALEEVAEIVKDCLPLERDNAFSISMELGGKPELDRKYKRLDIPAAFASVRMEAGIDIPLPRFLAMPVQASSVETWGQCSGWDSFDSGSDKPSVGAAYRKYWQSVRHLLRHKRIIRDAVTQAGLVLVIAAGVASAIWGFLQPNIAQPSLLVGFAVVLGSMAALISLGITIVARLDGGGMLDTKLVSLGNSLPQGMVLPKEARKTIRAAEREFEEVLLVMDAPGWKVGDAITHREPKVDPLIVGFSNGVFYLVGEFNLTSTEKWVKSEF